MLNQFSRTELLLGNDGVEKLKKSRVAVFGVGGVGGYTVEALARSGVGTIDIVDDDDVALTNINRQIIATHDTVGMAKVDVAEKRIKSINPDCVVNKHKCFYLPETTDKFDFSQYDYDVDAIDTVKGKIELVRCASFLGKSVKVFERLLDLYEEVGFINILDKNMCINFILNKNFRFINNILLKLLEE